MIVLIIAVFFCFLCLLSFYLETKHFIIKRYSIASEKLSEAFDGMKIAVIADLHNQSYGKKNEKLIEAIRKEKPEFIVIAGDLMVSKPGRDFMTAIELLEALTKDFPVYYALGNHEYRLGLYPAKYGTMSRDYLRAVLKTKTILLRNEKITYQKNGEIIHIYGLEIGKKYYERKKPVTMKKEYLERILGKKEEAQYSILIAHNPMYFPVYAEWGADLVLSGHYHGGIAKIPGIGGIISPNLKLFPEYDSGIYQSQDKTMILSAGLGSHTLPFRAWNPPELVVIELHTKSNRQA